MDQFCDDGVTLANLTNVPHLDVTIRVAFDRPDLSPVVIATAVGNDFKPNGEVVVGILLNAIGKLYNAAAANIAPVNDSKPVLFAMDGSRLN